MFVETSRYGFQLELSRAWLVQFAERLVFPNRSRSDHSDGRFIFARLTSIRRLARGVAVRDHVPFNGRDPGDARLHLGTRTNHARVADFTNAPDLSADAELLHLESDFARDQRRVGELGQTRTHSQRARARVTKMSKHE